MKLLLDTNVFIWASREPIILSPSARAALSDPLNERFVSMVSMWEMQIKHSLGKFPLPDKIDAIGKLWLQPLAAQLLSIELKHIGRLYDLPPAHRDPFDRIIIAQALTEGMTIVSTDTVFRSYGVNVIW